MTEPDINYANVQEVTPEVAGGTTLSAQQLVLGPDVYHENNTLGTAAYVGSGSTLNIANAAIFPSSTEFPGTQPGVEFYQVTAATTGTLDFQVFFRTFGALLPDGGALDLTAYDVGGNVIATATAGAGNQAATFGADGGNGNPNARIRIPAVAGQTYYLEVSGAQTTVVNGYSMTVV